MKVLITGASSGIGASLASKFASCGYDLILVARDKKRLDNVKKECLSKGDIDVSVYATDLVSVDNCKKIYDKYKDVDILVNNAGFGLFGEVVDTDLDKELEMIDTNVKALHILTKLYLEDMVRRDSGQILNVASIAGFMSGPLMSTYYATKNYVVSYSEAIREELRKRKSNVKISILCPGPVRTNFDNVAGVSFSLKGKSSDEVADYAYAKLKRGKFYIVPGFLVRCIRILSHMVPRRISTKIVYYQQSRKKDV